MALTPAQVVAEALQLLLQSEGDGWTLSAYVAVLGLEKVNPDGSMESLVWHHAAPNQPCWTTRGLLDELEKSLTNAGED